MRNLAQTYLSLTKEDLSVLKAVEAGMRNHEWVPIDDVSRISGLPLFRVEYRLRHLKELVTKETAHYEGYKIGFDAYDLIALRDLVDRDVVRSLGDLVGVGKESIVYEAMGEGPMVVKFHREGRTSFKHVRRVREHLKDRPRSSWIYAAKLAADREFEVLSRLEPEVSAPRPISHSRHAVAMELVEGVRLDRALLPDPRQVLDTVLHEIASAWRLGVIHADLSEFNVFVVETGIKIIDWPQAVSTDHGHAKELLQRDLRNVLRFFRRKHMTEVSLKDGLAQVLGGEPEEVLDEVYG